MIRIQGGNDRTPTLLLAQALRAIAPQLVDAYDRNHADLTIVARLTVPAPVPMATAGAWYDLHWSHPAVVVRPEPAGDYPDVENALIGHVDTIPAPRQIPAEQRIAAAPPVTLDGLAPEVAHSYGGVEETLRILRDQRDAAIRDDRRAETYDWPALAAQIIDRARQLTPPPLTAGQRAHVAATRLLEAHREVHAARESMVAHLTNAQRAGDTADADQVRRLLDIIDPSRVPA